MQIIADEIIVSVYLKDLTFFVIVPFFDKSFVRLYLLDLIAFLFVSKIFNNQMIKIIIFSFLYYVVKLYSILIIDSKIKSHKRWVEKEEICHA